MTTKKLLDAYIQETPAPMFLTGLFTKNTSYHNSQDIEVDIQLQGEDVAVPVANLADGYKTNQTTGFTMKKTTPPAYLEGEAFHALTLMDRQIGKTDYDDPNFQQIAVAKTLRSARILENKIRRGMELQASQILTTGAISLVDSGGNVVFAENFGAKVTHFFNSNVAWNGAADPTSDILNGCDLISDDASKAAVKVIMGAGSLEAALAITSFQKRFDSMESKLGQIMPQNVDATRGGMMVGRIFSGGYWLEVWTYNGKYKHPQTGTMTKYVPDDKVIILSDARFNATFGGIPTFGNDGRAAKFIPGRIQNAAAGMDMQMNAWISPDGSVLNVGFGSRPLLIPTEIDGFACLDTQI